MQRSTSHRCGSFAATVHSALCAVGVVMLLCFPVARVHNFGTHFRTPAVRRSIERHTSVAQTDDGAVERVAPSRLLPNFFAPAAPLAPILARREAAPARAPVIRLLSRRKLCSSRSCGSDPLLLNA